MLIDVETTRNQRVFAVYQLLKERELVKNKRDFANRVGFVNTHWSEYENEKRTFTDLVVNRLVNIYGASRTYMDTGEGEIFDRIVSHDDVMVNQSVVKEPSPALKPRGAEVQMVPGELRGMAVPLVPARAQAGFAESFLDDTQHEDLDIYPHIMLPGEAELREPLAFEVRGDSMLPTLLPGSIVICTPIPEGNMEYASSGLFVVVFVISGYADLVVKRIKTNDLSTTGTLTLYSDNEDGGELTIRRADLRAMWKVRRSITEF